MKTKILIISSAILFFLLLTPLRFFTVTGSSMEPFITENDVVVVNTAFNQLKVGEVITYRHVVDGREYLFTHRIVEIDGDVIKTKGDALKNPDNYVVSKKDVVGKVVFVLPFLGAFIRFASSLAGWVSFILIPSSILIAMEIRKIWRLKNGH